MHRPAHGTRGLVVEMTGGTSQANAGFRRELGLYYDLVKASVERIVKDLTAALENLPVTAEQCLRPVDGRGEGCTFPVTESSLKQMTGVGAPAGKVQPDAHRSAWRGLRPRGRRQG